MVTFGFAFMPEVDIGVLAPALRKEVKSSRRRRKVSSVNIITVKAANERRRLLHKKRIVQQQVSLPSFTWKWRIRKGRSYIGRATVCACAC